MFLLAVTKIIRIFPLFTWAQSLLYAPTENGELDGGFGFLDLAKALVVQCEKRISPPSIWVILH